MSNPIHISVNTQQFAEAFADWMIYKRVSERDAVRTQARLLGQQLIAWTPPLAAFGFTPRATGRNAVARDIRKVFAGVHTASLRAARQTKVNGKDAIRVFARLGTAVVVTPTQFRPDLSLAEMEAIHSKARVSRGRVLRKAKETQEGTALWLDRVVVSKPAMKAFASMIQRRVGCAKGGWGISVLGLGGSVPNWMRGFRSGSFVDYSESNRQVTMTNTSPWASAGNSREHDRVLGNAFRARAEKMRADIERTQRRSAARAGFATSFVAA